MEDENVELKRRVQQGVLLNNLESSEVVSGRVAYELSIIQASGFSGYFLLLARIAEVCNELSLIRSFGRGTAPNSIVNYCLNITNINPIQHKLPFERFMLPHQQNQPDIDLDIPEGCQKKVLERLREKYPEYAVYSLAFEPRNEKELPNINFNGKPLRRHSCGFAITKAVLPSFRIEEDDQEYYLVDNPETDMNFQNKIDLVGQAYLSKLQSISDRLGKQHHPYQISLRDVYVFELFAKGDKSGIFCFDFTTMEKVLAHFPPNSIIDLAIIQALFRRGVWEYSSNLILTKNKSVGFQNQRINEILEETYGLLIFQETFLSLAYDLAGISLAEAETWRKNILRDKSGQQMQEFLTLFSNACQDKSALNEKDITSLTKLISDMLPIAFPKAHALSYATIAYWGAYYKTYFCAEFAEVFETETEVSF
jgi:DNA polymerase-3 subunit alpha